MANTLRRAWRWLARTDVAAILLVLAIVLAAAGSLFPQNAHPLAGVNAALWTVLVQEHYGGLAGLLTGLGVFWFFRSPLVLALLALLVLATLACTLSRWPALWRNALRRPERPSDSLLDAAPHLATVAAAPSTGLPDRVQDCLRGRGFRVVSENLADGVYVRGDRNSLARLATLVHHLAILLLVLGAAASAAFGWHAPLVLPWAQTTTVPHSGSLTVRNDGFSITRYPDGSPANYEAQLSIDDATGTFRGIVAVNRPLALPGVRLYLSGYQPAGAGNTVTILAVHDPGYGLVVAGGILFLLGLTVALAFPHCSVHVRIAADGTLRLAGFADRGAAGFDREFAGLAAALRKATLSGP